MKENKGKFILWLQKLLLECCFAKLCCTNDSINLNLTNAKNRIIEPIPHHCICKCFLPFFCSHQFQCKTNLFSIYFTVKKQSVPVVPWSTEQTNVLLCQPFILLLHKLGFHLPADAGKLFVRIPEFWTADIMFSVAEKLGPIDKCLFHFRIFFRTFS